MKKGVLFALIGYTIWGFFPLFFKLLHAGAGFSNYGAPRGVVIPINGCHHAVPPGNESPAGSRHLANFWFVFYRWHAVSHQLGNLCVGGKFRLRG